MLRCQDIAKDVLNEKIYYPNEMSEKDFDIFEDADIDYIPAFTEKKKFVELYMQEKAFLRDYIRSEIIEHWEFSGKTLNENELIEIRKRMMEVFEEDCNIILKNDATLRRFFHDNATSIINKLQKKNRS